MASTNGKVQVQTLRLLTESFTRLLARRLIHVIWRRYLKVDNTFDARMEIAAEQLLPKVPSRAVMRAIAPSLFSSMRNSHSGLSECALRLTQVKGDLFGPLLDILKRLKTSSDVQ